MNEVIEQIKKEMINRSNAKHTECTVLRSVRYWDIYISKNGTEISNEHDVVYYCYNCSKHFHAGQQLRSEEFRTNKLLSNTCPACMSLLIGLLAQEKVNKARTKTRE